LVATPALPGHLESTGSLAADGRELEGAIASGRVRRASQHQGRALEKLGHAVEYLVDSRMFLVDEPATSADAEAVQILMRLSSWVFSECSEAPERLSVVNRLSKLMGRRMGRV
jgi:enamine deaminase RidA (YjgF/YER057c/UK114 family)